MWKHRTFICKWCLLKSCDTETTGITSTGAGAWCHRLQNIQQVREADRISPCLSQQPIEETILSQHTVVTVCRQPHFWGAGKGEIAECKFPQVGKDLWRSPKTTPSFKGITRMLRDNRNHSSKWRFTLTGKLFRELISLLTLQSTALELR